MTQPHPRPLSRHAGFTLIELMIVVALVGVLASVAYPSYREYVNKSRRAEARVALMETLQQQERYMSQHNTYLAFSENPAQDTGVPFRRYSGESASSAAFRIGAESATGACAGQTIANCVVVFAKPHPAGSDPAITKMSIASTGVKGCEGSNTKACWK